PRRPGDPADAASRGGCGERDPPLPARGRGPALSRPRRRLGRRAGDGKGARAAGPWRVADGADAATCLIAPEDPSGRDRFTIAARPWRAPRYSFKAWNVASAIV